MTEIGVCHVFGSESHFFSHHRHIVGSSLEAGGICKFGFAVVGGFLTAKSSGNHVATLVGLTGATVHEHVAGFIFHKQIATCLCQHGHGVAEGEFGVVVSCLEFSDAHTFSRFNAGFSYGGGKNHVDNFFGIGHAP